MCILKEKGCLRDSGVKKGEDLRGGKQAQGDSGRELCSLGSKHFRRERTGHEVLKYRQDIVNTIVDTSHH